MNTMNRIRCYCFKKLNNLLSIKNGRHRSTIGDQRIWKNEEQQKQRFIRVSKSLKRMIYFEP